MENENNLETENSAAGDRYKMTMPVGVVKIAEDSDFRRFKEVCEGNDGWKLEVNKQKTMVWTKANDLSDFNMVKVSVLDFFCHFLDLY